MYQEESDNDGKLEVNEAMVNKCDEDSNNPGKCSCPVRTSPPPVPEKIPFPPTEQIIPKLKAWILQRYRSSAFNCCHNQKLPLVKETIPLNLHVDKNAKPVAIHKPFPVPVHWKEAVKAGLDKDVKMGVLEKVPVGEPTTWCSRMVVVPKKNGKPRRCVDFQQLNKVSLRQTHPVKTPFHQAMSIPPNTYRSCLDAYEGFQSIPIKVEDRHLTTFVTEYGRCRYKTLPQGFLSATDGYTDRFDFITRDIDNLERCVDDAVLWDDDITGNFFRTCQYLTRCSEAGILFTEEKFQFCLKEIEFLGFHVDNEGVKPSKDFIKVPTNITGIRSWFGLVEQSSYAFTKTKVMEVFRPLLKPKAKFEWSPELDESFIKSKKEIIEKIINGIKTFDPKLVTCLATDYSRSGIRFHLLQKKCKCPNITPICCKDGWSIVFAGSRFLNDAESRYAVIEGEALSAAWAMGKCKHFLLGCTDFVLAVDHRPLLGVLNDKSLEAVENPRLQRMKEKTLRFKFSIVHVPGIMHKTSDATSRSPVSASEQEVLTLSTINRMMNDKSDKMQSDIESDNQRNQWTNFIDVMSLNATVVSWNTVKHESEKDEKQVALARLIEDGIDDKERWPKNLQEFYNYRGKLSSKSPVLYYNDRIIIPSSLWNKILEILHSSHSGVASMIPRAQTSVWWPGLQADIEKTRQGCHSCNVSTPSQPAAPPTPLPSPSFPFEMICSDYFSYGGHRYLVIVDRFSNWINVYKVNKGEGAEMLVKLLRQHFMTYGVSSELASDGGLEYVSNVCQIFLRQWGVHHRLSSAYFPHSNNRGEVAVRQAKRMIRENTDNSGSLDNDNLPELCSTIGTHH